MGYAEKEVPEPWTKPAACSPPGDGEGGAGKIT